MQNEQENRYFVFARYVLVASCVVAGVVAVILFLWYAASLLLLVYAGVLLSILLRGCGRLIQKLTGFGRGLSITLVAFLLLLFLIASVWLITGRLGAQIGELQRQIPQAIEGVHSYVEQHDWARQLVDSLPNVYDWFSERSSTLISSLTGFASTTVGVIVNVVVVIVIGLYVSLRPQLYSTGIVRLVPFEFRDRTRELFRVLDRSLWRWLGGRTVLMAVNGLLTAAGLWLLGIPLAATLGLMTGLLNFIPNFGPWIAAVPAILIAFLQSPMHALYTLLLYIVLQGLDGYVFTPLIDKESVDLPPAVTITAQILMAAAFGFVGILLASPLAAAVMIAVKMLYVEDVLGDPITEKREDSSETSA